MLFRSDAAMSVSEKGISYPIPGHLKDTHYKGADELGHTGYKYAHDYPNHYVKQQYLPDKLKGTQFYEPSGTGYEVNIKEYLDKINQ